MHGFILLFPPAPTAANTGAGKALTNPD